MKCIFCGAEFEQNKKGRKKNYCAKIECKKRANSLAQHKYHQKKRMEAEKKIAEFCTQKRYEPEKKEEQLVRTNPNNEIRLYREDEIIYVKDLLPVADELAIEVLDFAKRLGALKYEGEQLKIKLAKEQSKNDQNDSKLLHFIESTQKMTVGEIIKLFCDEGKNREQRRDAKCFWGIVNGLIVGIPNNPHEYAQKAIKGIAKTNVTYAIRNEKTKINNSEVRKGQTI